MFFRLTLDTPYAFAVENGYNLAKHCADFRTPAGSLTNCYREPVTGLVMLQPTFMTPQYPISQTGLSDFRTTVKPGFWQNTLRGLSNAPMFTSGKPAGSDPNDIAISAAPYLPVINPGATDTLVWTFESQFTLKPDEGFVWYEWSVSDEVNRETNWFAVQWDNVLIHFSGDGTARVYSYADRTQLTVAPTLIDTFQIATATQLHQKYNYFWFQPIPGMGLLLQHASYPMGIKTTLSSADHRSVNGHLIPATPRQMPDGTNRQFDASPLRIAQNPHYDFIFGCDRIQFAASGTYTDAAFDIGYQPSVGIGAASPLVLFSEQQNITLTTLDNAAEFAWTPPMQQGRAQLSLTTSDTSYTPFLFGYNIIWPPLFNTRNTTPVVLSSTGLPGNLDISERLEFTQDEKGDFEGSATMILGSAAAQAIADRGDATFVLESSTDGATWTTIDGGLAKNWEYDVISYMGNAEAYHAKCTLHGLRERFRETYQAKPFALDGLTIAQANDNILTSSGFAAIGLANYPDQARATTMPFSENGKGWRFGGREGDTCENLIDILMFLLRGQNLEFLEVYNWNAQTWQVIQKPHDTSAGGTWKLYPTQGQANLATNAWYMGPGAHFTPEPPEANVVIVEGLETTQPADTNRVAVISPSNKDSLNNVSSPDYLGRYKSVKANFSFVTDETDLARFSLRILDAVQHRRQKANKVPIPTLNMALAPNVHVQVMKLNGTDVRLDGWIKKRTVIIERDIDAHMLLDLDSVWQMEVPR